MDSDRDVDTRIAQLEQELAQLTGGRAKATRVAPAPAMPRRRWSLAWIAVGLLAVSLPVTAVIGTRSREVEHRRELALAAKQDLAHRRLEIAQQMLDVATDDNKSIETRRSALRYLAERLSDKSRLRAWARQELAALEGPRPTKKKRSCGQPPA